MATDRKCTFTVTVHRQPYCPSCGSALTDDGWHSVCGIAMCTACQGGNGRGLLNLITSMTHYPVGKIITRRGGIAWYTPSVTGPPNRPPTLIGVPRYLEHPATVMQQQMRAEGRTS